MFGIIWTTSTEFRIYKWTKFWKLLSHNLGKQNINLLRQHGKDIIQLDISHIYETNVPKRRTFMKHIQMNQIYNRQKKKV